MQVTPNEIISRYGSGERNFEGLNLGSINLSGTMLRGASFKNANLANSTFDNADLSGCDFSGANLERASFVNAVLRDTRFEGANLSFAVLRAAFLEQTNFSRSNLQWAHLCRDDLSRCNISDANLSWSCLVDTTMNNQQMEGIPTQMMGTIRRVEEDPSVVQREEVVLGAGYKPIGTTGPALGAGYKPIQQSGAASGYKALTAAEAMPYKAETKTFDPFKKKNQEMC